MRVVFVPMTRTRLFLATITAYLVATFAASAQVSMMITGASPGGTSYQGVGDIQPMFFYGGVWAYSAATRGSNVVQVCNAGDANCEDKATGGTTGQLPATVTVNGVSCASVTCTVKTIYNFGTDISNTPSVTQSSEVARATLVNSGCPPSTLWCMKGTVNSVYSYSSSGGPGSQPVTVTMVINPTDNTSFQQLIGNGTSGSFTGVYIGTAVCGSNSICLSSNSVGPIIAVSTSTNYAFQGVFNGSSSTILLNGSSNTGTTSGMNWNSTTLPFIFGGSGAGLDFSGYVSEIGFVASAVSGGTQSSIESNQRTRNGF